MRPAAPRQPDVASGRGHIDDAGHVAGVGEGGLDVGERQLGIGGEGSGGVGIMGELLQHELHRDARAPDDGLAAEDGGIGDDAVPVGVLQRHNS